MTVSALAGLGFALSSTWVHYRILRDPFYSSFCDVTSTFSCTEAYTSRYGAVAGVPVALIGALFFALVLALIALCQRDATSRRNLGGYVFVLATLGLATVLYFAYVSFFVLQAICVLCVGTYLAVIGLFLASGAATGYPMSSLPNRASHDLRTLIRTPAALSVVMVFIAAAVLAIMLFPTEPVSASAGTPPAAASAGTTPGAPAAPPAQAAGSPMQELEKFLAESPRAPIVVPTGGAAVTIVKFNDYQCPPCALTFREYKPILAKLQQQHPGKITFLTRDFPLDKECNSADVGHASACEAAVAVRLAREKGRADAMEEWLFANQPSLTPDKVKEGLKTIANVSDFDARYPTTLQLVKGEIAQGHQLGVRGTPTFFMNGIKLPTLRPDFFEAAVLWELRRVSAAK
jgi:uncharacterized membrane protein/protein-disulfide isomerase